MGRGGRGGELVYIVWVRRIGLPCSTIVCSWESARVWGEWGGNVVELRISIVALRCIFFKGPIAGFFSLDIIIYFFSFIFFICSLQLELFACLFLFFFLFDFRSVYGGFVRLLKRKNELKKIYWIYFGGKRLISWEVLTTILTDMWECRDFGAEYKRGGKIVPPLDLIIMTRTFGWISHTRSLGHCAGERAREEKVISRLSRSFCSLLIFFFLFFFFNWGLYYP